MTIGSKVVVNPVRAFNCCENGLMSGNGVDIVGLA